MTLSAGTPIVLLLLLAVPLMIWLAGGKLRNLGPGQRRWAFLVRGALFSLLILALAEPRLGQKDDRLSIVLAVDASASVQDSQRLQHQEWVSRTRSLARPDDRISVIEFGRWASSSDLTASGRTPPIDATNLADALNLSESLHAPDGHRRLVLLTDGQQNLGRAQDPDRVGVLAAQGIEVSFLPPEPPSLLLDVLMRGLAAPDYQREGETLQVDALVESSHPTTATIRVFLDGQQTLERQVELKAGRQRVPLVVRPGGLGFHAIRAEVQATDDGLKANNSAEAFTVVKASGRVLVLESREGEAADLQAALADSGLRAETRPVSAIPPSAVPLQIYDSIVLVNVPSTALTLDQQTTLQSYVEDYGRGLLVAGGNTSFSLGGYGNSPLGDMLPVDPVPPARREVGNVALFLVIDKSGSMELYRQDVSKMSMAREAAMLAVDALNSDDQVAVLAFDTRFQWIVPLSRIQNPADKQAVKSRIGGIRADGGTYIFPALEAAYQAAQGSQAKLKHIVLLTDGQAPEGDYAGLMARMKPQNITLTTIGVGSDTDQALLNRLAMLGDGRAYFTERPQEIPKIVTRETTIVSRNALIEGLIRPLQTEQSPLLADLQGQELPVLNGYVATVPRARAHTILTSDRGDPLLASWQFGLGRVVAWTSDTRPAWAGEWLGSAAARRMWGQAVRWSMPSPTDPSFQLSSGAQGDQVTLKVQAYEQGGRFADRLDVRATVTTPDRRAFQVPLRQAGPGSYEVIVQAPGPGAYEVQVDDVRNGAASRTESGGFVVTADSELRTIGPNRALLEQLAQATGGRELAGPADVLNRDIAQPPVRWTPLWPWLLALAALLLPLDVALRRLSLRLRRR